MGVLVGLGGSRRAMVYVGGSFALIVPFGWNVCFGGLLDCVVRFWLCRFSVQGLWREFLGVGV